MHPLRVCTHWHALYVTHWHPLYGIPSVCAHIGMPSMPHTGISFPPPPRCVHTLASPWCVLTLAFPLDHTLASPCVCTHWYHPRVCTHCHLLGVWTQWHSLGACTTLIFPLAGLVYFHKCYCIGERAGLVTTEIVLKSIHAFAIPSSTDQEKENSRMK